MEPCLAHDVMIAGPGNPGPFTEIAYKESGDIRNSLRRFCVEAKQGDIVLLRIGTNRILAVGEIADGQPSWNDVFADIDGWDLQHVRRVRWFPEPERVFPKQALGSRARTFAAVKVPAIRKWVEGLDVAISEQSRPLKPLPSAAPLLDEGQAAAGQTI